MKMATTGVPTAAARWVMPESLPMYTRAVESQQARSYRPGIRTALSRGSSGPAHHFTGMLKQPASSRYRSRGQFFLGLLEKGWITAKFSGDAGGTGMRGGIDGRRASM